MSKIYEVEFTEETQELVDDLVEFTGVEMGEVLVNGLCLYMDIIQQYAEGNIFLIQKPDGSTEEYPFFEEDEGGLH